MVEQFNLDDVTRRGFGDRSGVSDPIIPQGGYDPQAIARANGGNGNKPPMPAPTPKASEASGGSRIDKSNLADNDPHKSNADIAYVVRTGGGDYPVFYKGSPSAEKWHAEYATNKQAGHDVYNSEVTGLSYKIQGGGSGSSGGQRQMTPAEAGHAAAERSRAESARRGISPESAEAGHQAAMRTRAAFEKTRAENANKGKDYYSWFGRGAFGNSDITDNEEFKNYDEYDKVLLGLAEGTTAAKFLGNFMPKGGTGVAGKLISKVSPLASKATSKLMQVPAAGLVYTGVTRALAQATSNDPDIHVDYEKLGRNLVVGASLGLLSDPNAAARKLGQSMRIAKNTGRSVKDVLRDANKAEGNGWMDKEPEIAKRIMKFFGSEKAAPKTQWKFNNYPEMNMPQGRPMPERMPRGFIGETSAPAQTPASLAEEVTGGAWQGAWKKKPEPSYLERDAFGGNKHFSNGSGPHLQHGGAIHKMRGGLRTMKLKKFTK